MSANTAPTPFGDTIDHLGAADATVQLGRELIAQAREAWTAVMRTAAWDSPAGEAFAAAADDERTELARLIDRADAWCAEMRTITTSGVCF